MRSRKPINGKILPVYAETVGRRGIHSRAHKPLPILLCITAEKCKAIKAPAIQLVRHHLAIRLSKVDVIAHPTERRAELKLGCFVIRAAFLETQHFPEFGGSSDVRRFHNHLIATEASSVVVFTDKKSKDSFSLAAVSSPIFHTSPVGSPPSTVPSITGSRWPG